MATIHFALLLLVFGVSKCLTWLFPRKRHVLYPCRLRPRRHQHTHRRLREFFAVPFLFSFHDAIPEDSEIPIFSAIRLCVTGASPWLQRFMKLLRVTRRHLESLVWRPRKPPDKYLSFGASKYIFQVESIPFYWKLLMPLIPSNISLSPATAFVCNIVRTITRRPTSTPDVESFSCFSSDVPGFDLRKAPLSFVSDTDSNSFVVDSGANCVILNDKSLFTTYKDMNLGVKGLHGKPVSAIGVGSVSFPLSDNEGSIHQLVFTNAVHVPSSPYHLLPPQLWKRNMTTNGFEATTEMPADSDDWIFKWRATSDGPWKIKHIPLADNDLFFLHTAPGYHA